MPEDPSRFEDEDEDELPVAASPVPTVAPPARYWEYRVDLVGTDEVAQAEGFAERLNRIAQDGWDLYGVTDAGQQKALILRRPKPAAREHRQVGFTPRAGS